MKYCKRCLYPENHPLNITFDEQGICSGCRVHEEKDTLNWNERKEKCEKRGLAEGESYTFIFNEAGNWRYHDHLRSSLTGTIVVR